MSGFPENFRFDITGPIDKGMSWVLVHWDAFFDAISRFTLSLFAGVEWVLNIIPWWLLIVASRSIYSRLVAPVEGGSPVL